MLFSGLRKQSDTTYGLYFLLIASSDHITGLTGKSGSVVVSLSKNGAGGGVPAGAISEVDATNFPGLYKVAGNATDSGTLGPLFLHAKDAASDPYDSKYDIVNYDPFTFQPSVTVAAYASTSVTPLQPATAGRTLVVDAAGLADANVVKVGPTGSGTAQTARDIGGALPAAAPGANNGLPTTDGTQLNQTVNLVAGQLIFKKNVALPNFSFPMFDTTGALKTGLTVTASIRKDAAASFMALAGAVTEIGATGWYTVDWAQAETNANTIAFSATATGAVPTCQTIITQA